MRLSTRLQAQVTNRVAHSGLSWWNISPTEGALTLQGPRTSLLSNPNPYSLPTGKWPSATKQWALEDTSLHCVDHFRHVPKDFSHQQRTGFTLAASKLPAGEGRL